MYSIAGIYYEKKYLQKSMSFLFFSQKVIAILNACIYYSNYAHMQK